MPIRALSVEKQSFQESQLSKVRCARNILEVIKVSGTQILRAVSVL
jgi:hypothetical protein